QGRRRAVDHRCAGVGAARRPAGPRAREEGRQEDGEEGRQEGTCEEGGQEGLALAGLARNPFWRYQIGGPGQLRRSQPSAQLDDLSDVPAQRLGVECAAYRDRRREYVTLFQ